MITVTDAAGRLGVTPHEVRRLIHTGVLTGRRLGRQFLVDEASVDARRLQRVLPGRVLTPANAWGILFAVSGESAPWLATSTRSRLMGPWLAETDAAMLTVACRHRATRRRLRILPLYRERLVAEPSVVLTGLSAAVEVGADIAAVDPPVELSCSPTDVDLLSRRYALSDEGQANVLFSVPSVTDVAILRRLLDRRTMPPGVVAADLTESDDARTRRAGLTLLQTAIDQFRSGRA